MLTRAVFYWILAYYQGFVAFAIPCFGYSMTQHYDGRMDDLYGTCFVTLVIIIASEHVTAYTRVRSWNWVVFGFLAFSLFNNGIDVIIVEYFLGREIRYRQFPDIMGELKFWLVVLIAVAISSLPLYLQKQAKMLIHRPAFFLK
jgi:hypothetical protein